MRQVSSRTAAVAGGCPPLNHMSRPCCPGPCAGPARSPRHLISTRVVLPQMGPHRRAFRGCWTWHRSLHFDQLVRAPSNLATPLPPGRRNRPWHDLTALLTPPRSCALVSHATLDICMPATPRLAAVRLRRKRRGGVAGARRLRDSLHGSRRFYGAARLRRRYLRSRAASLELPRSHHIRSSRGLTIFQ